MHHEIEKFHHTDSEAIHHGTTTMAMTHTTNHHMIKFHGDGCFRDSDDSDSDGNHSTTPPPSSTGSLNGGSSSAGPLTPAIQFYGEV